MRFLHGDRQILDDRLHELRIVALGGGRLFGFVKLELGRADADRVAVDDRRFVDLLAVHERAVAAFGVADDPAIGRAGERGVDARAERVGQRDVAIGAAADERFAAGIERKIRAGAVAREDRQVSVKTAAGDRHKLPGKIGGTARNCMVHQRPAAWNAACERGYTWSSAQRR